MKMKKQIILPIAFFVSLALYYAGFYLGDLVGIGGYDGEASKALYYEFQFGKYSNSFIYDLTTAIALICLAIGLIGFLATLLYIFYLFIKAIVRKLGKAVQ